MEGNLGVGFVLIAFAVVIYFLPMFVAYSRDHPQSTAIVFLNMLLGWTLIGWVAALVWALTVTPKAAHAESDAELMRDCPYCAEPVRVAAIKCKHCGSAIPNDLLETSGDKL